jgi:hypothetical protein
MFQAGAWSAVARTVYTENFYEIVSKPIQGLVAMNPCARAALLDSFPVLTKLTLGRARPNTPPVQEYAQSYRRGNVFEVEFPRRGRSELFRTESGLLGTGPRSVQVGDSVWIVPGVKVPMILRKGDRRNHFRIIGNAYVHGCMQGEALERGQLEM